MNTLNPAEFAYWLEPVRRQTPQQVNLTVFPIVHKQLGSNLESGIKSGSYDFILLESGTSQLAGLHGILVTRVATTLKSQPDHIKESFAGLLADKLAPAGFVRDMSKLALVTGLPMFPMEKRSDDANKKMDRVIWESYGLHNEAVNSFSKGSLEGAVNSEIESVLKLAVSSLSREQDMRRAVMELPAELLRRYADLYSRDKVNGMVVIGVMHSSIVDELQKDAQGNPYVSITRQAGLADIVNDTPEGRLHQMVKGSLGPKWQWDYNTDISSTQFPLPARMLAGQQELLIRRIAASFFLRTMPSYLLTGEQVMDMVILPEAIVERMSIGKLKSLAGIGGLPVEYGAAVLEGIFPINRSEADKVIEGYLARHSRSLIYS